MGGAGQGISDKIAGMFGLADQPMRRADGRDLSEVRPIEAEVDLLPVPHGSAYFQRGSTSALCAVSVGPTKLLRVRPNPNPNPNPLTH